MSMTRVIRLKGCGVEARFAMISLKSRWGSGTIRQIDSVDDVFNECGMEIFVGLKRLCVVMCFLVLIINHITSSLRPPSDSSKFLDFWWPSSLSLDSCKCFSSAFDVLWTC